MAASKDRTTAQLETLPVAGIISRPPALASLQAAVAACLHIRTEAARPSSAPVQISGERFHILLAEDYELNQRLAVRLLERAGYTCDVVEDGRKALDASASGAYDIILMDCQMPNMDGFEATRLIRQREFETGEHIPIVAMTANAMQGDRERCLASGMDDYLPKPIRVEALHDMLRKYLVRPSSD
jgi:CheY-like chemotaxis protein